MPRRDVEEWFVQVGREMSSLAEEMASGRTRVAGTHCWEPRIDLFEEESRLLLRVEIAGVRADEISLHYIPERHSIIVKGVRPETVPGGEARRAAHVLEVMVGEFAREVALPAISIDASSIRAQYRNGMLLVMVPKVDRVIVARTTVVREI